MYIIQIGENFAFPFFGKDKRQFVKILLVVIWFILSPADLTFEPIFTHQINKGTKKTFELKEIMVLRSILYNNQLGNPGVAQGTLVTLAVYPHFVLYYDFN